VRAAEVHATEVSEAEIRNLYSMIVSPCIPHRYALLKNVEMFLARHNRTLTTLKYGEAIGLIDNLNHQRSLIIEFM
jgi:hypothetical protein